MKNDNRIKRMINAGLTASACNFKCSYCYIAQIDEVQSSRIPKFPQSPETIGRALSVKRLGGVCLFNLCANGETLLPKEIPAILYQLLDQGHYVELVTNGTIESRFQEIFSFPPELLSRLCFKFSFHFVELKRRNLLDLFTKHVHQAKAIIDSFLVIGSPPLNWRSRIVNNTFAHACRKHRIAFRRQGR